MHGQRNIKSKISVNYCTLSYLSVFSLDSSILHSTPQTRKICDATASISFRLYSIKHVPVFRVDEIFPVQFQNINKYE